MVNGEGNSPYLITPNEQVPIYSIRNIPRKVNQINRERYFKED